MSLFIAEINRYENSYRVLDEENRSHCKGTREKCTKYMKDDEQKKRVKK